MPSPCMSPIGIDSFIFIIEVQVHPLSPATIGFSAVESDVVEGEEAFVTEGNDDEVEATDPDVEEVELIEEEKVEVELEENIVLDFESEVELLLEREM